jgi:hypothetical protein
MTNTAPTLVSLSTELVQRIGDTLASLPYAQVADVMNRLQAEANASLAAQAEAAQAAPPAASKPSKRAPEAKG